MASDDLDTLARLRGLLDVSRVVRDDESLPEVLNAIAGTIADSLGYKVVVVNLYRPAWDDFEVTTVRDYNQEAVEQLLGTRGGWNAWAPLLDDRFKRGGVYFVPAGEYDWQNDMLSITPDIPVSDDPNDWHPEDALFVPLTRNDGHLLGILSVDEPVSGLRPADEELEVLVALAEHVALALESAQEGSAREPLPQRPRAAAAGVVASDRDAFDRRRAAFGGRGHLGRARLREGQHRAAQPGHGRPDAAVGRGLEPRRPRRERTAHARPGRAAAGVRVRDRGLLPADPDTGPGTPAGAPSHLRVGVQRRRARMPGRTTGCWCPCTTATAA